MDIIGKSYMFISSDSLTVKMKTPKSFSSHNGHQNRPSLESGLITSYTVSLDIQIVQKYVQAMPTRTKNNGFISHCIKSKV